MSTSCPGLRLHGLAGWFVLLAGAIASGWGGGGREHHVSLCAHSLRHMVLIHWQLRTGLEKDIDPSGKHMMMLPTFVTRMPDG